MANFPHTRPHIQHRLASLGFSLSLLVLTAGSVSASHLAREDPPEPIFTQRAFIENNVENGSEWTRGLDGNEIELGLGVTWIFFDQLQLGAEVPIGIVMPDQSATTAGLSDINFSAKWLFCCDETTGYTFISARVDVNPPTGNRSRDLGGDGHFGFSLNLGYGLTVMESLQDLSIQFQLSYFQQMRLTDDQLNTAQQLGLPETLQKNVIWNLALVQPFFGGRLQISLEALGTSVVDALEADDRGSSLQLAAGFWVIPFNDNHMLSNLSIGLGGRVPVTDRREDRGGATLIFEFTFD